MSDTKFTEWAIVEVMGHQTYAGFVQEQTIGGASFIRVDVPAVGEHQAFTKLLGSGSIYAITPVSEEVAKMRAQTLGRSPLSVWDLPAEIQEKIRSRPTGLPAPQGDALCEEDGSLFELDELER